MNFSPPFSLKSPKHPLPSPLRSLYEDSEKTRFINSKVSLFTTSNSCVVNLFLEPFD